MNVLHKSYAHETHTHPYEWKWGAKKMKCESILRCLHSTYLCMLDEFSFIASVARFIYSYRARSWVYARCMCSRGVPERVCKCETIVHHSDCIMKYDVSQGNEARKWNQDESVRCDGTNLALVFASGRIRPNNNGTEWKGKKCVHKKRNNI